MYLESWHSTLKHRYLGGRKQRRLDYILNRIVKYDQDQEKVFEYQEEFRFNNKRTSLVLKYHKQAIVNFKKGNYKVTRNENSHVLQYLIEEGNEKFFVTMKDDDPNHWKSWAFNCEGCKTCFCLFECTCQDYRKRHNPCIHLHVITLDKTNGFKEFSKSDFEDTNDFDFDCDYDIDCCSTEAQQLSGNIETERDNVENEPDNRGTESESISDIPIDLATVRNTCEKFVGDVLCAIDAFPHRAKEFNDYVKEFTKKFNQNVNSDIDQIQSFQLTSPYKRTLIQKQIRRSPNKAKTLPNFFLYLNANFNLMIK